MRTIKIIMLCLFAMDMHGYSQAKHAGRDFWLTLGGCGEESWSASFYNRYIYELLSKEGKISLASKHHATVQFYFTNTGQTRSYIVSPGSVTEVFMDSNTNKSISNLQIEHVEDRSLHITSDSDIVVHYIDHEICLNDAMMIFPTDNQKKADIFYLQMPAIQSLKSAGIPNLVTMHPFSLVATCDNVELEITLTANTISHIANVPFTIRLKRGETYEISNPLFDYNNGAPANFSGSKIRILNRAQCCDNPVNVFYLSKALCIVDQCNLNIFPNGAADKLMEQMLPASWWGTDYPAVTWYLQGYANKRTYSPIRVFSLYNGNNIYFDNKLVRILNQGQALDTMVSDAVMIKGYKPIAVIHTKFSDCEFAEKNKTHDLGDTEMVWSIPQSNGLRETYFKTIWVNTQTYAGVINKGYYFLNIFSEKDNVNSILLNGQNVSTYFKNFLVNPKWQYAQISLDSNKTYHLTSGKKIVANMYMEYWCGGYSLNLGDMASNNTEAYDGNVDTVAKCIGKQTPLIADSTERYLWNTGDTAMQIAVIDTGAYWVKCFGSKLCGTYTTRHFYVKDIDTATIKYTAKIDTVYKCGTVELIANDADKYEWSTEATERQISAGKSGYYWVNEYRNISECQQSITPHVYYVKDKDFGISIDIGNDTTICKGRYLLLNSGIEASQWSDGTIGSSITVTEAGMYRASIIDSCGSLYSDSVLVYVRDCSKDTPCQIAFPSAFTPNGDNKNDVYRPITWGSLSDYHLLIYSRWGELMFDSHDVKGSWDGKHNGENMPGGVYMYICTVTCSRGDEVFKGDITLIR